MILTTFVANYVPLDIRQSRDFTGPRGWCHLMNLLLARLEKEGVARLDRIVEVPLYTFEQNDEWFAKLPLDFRKAEEVYVFGDRADKRDFEILQGKIRLLEDYDELTLQTPATAPLYWTNLGTGTTQATCYRGADESATWGDGEAAILMTTGSNINETRLITTATYTAGPGPAADNFINWDSNHPLTVALAATEQFKRLRDFLMLRYFARYKLLTAHTDEIPVDDKYEDVLANGLTYMALTPTDKRRAAYRQEFEESLGLLGSDIFTPSEEEARSQGREWPEFAETQDDQYDYIGE
jgi:hypothetical protein